MAEWAPEWIGARRHILLHLIPPLHKHEKAIIRIKSTGIWANTITFAGGINVSEVF